jgi:transcription-repair coupling factor (superfamily II helicase)
MLHLKFAEALSGGAPATAPGVAPAREHRIDPGTLMRLVSRNTKRGAQFTPQGILRWPLAGARAEDVLTDTRALLDALDAKHSASS